MIRRDSEAEDSYCSWLNFCKLFDSCWHGKLQLTQLTIQYIFSLISFHLNMQIDLLKTKWLTGCWDCSRNRSFSVSHCKNKQRVDELTFLLSDVCSEAFLHHKSNDVDLLDLSVFLSSTQPTPQSGSKVRSGDITTRPSLLTSSVRLWWSTWLVLVFCLMSYPSCTQYLNTFGK